MSTARHLIPASLLALLLACATGPQPLPEAPPARAPAPVDTRSLAEIREAIDALVGPLVEQGWMQGLAIAFVHPLGSEIVGYGQTAQGADAPEANTVFEIGSVTKVFTSLILAEMVSRGELRLYDPVSDLLPDDFQVPSQEDREVTLVDLSTHLSGLPRMPDNFAPADPENPYLDYDERLLREYLAGHTLRRTPGSRAEYSNLGAGLLGHALAEHAGSSYEALVRERILAPLGMDDTAIELSEDQLGRLAQGHDADGRPVSVWDIPGLAGAGALRSTPSDMLRFLQANMGLIDTPIREALDMAQDIRGPFDESNVMGLGWLISAAGICWHNGQTGGYHSFVALDRERGLGLVVLSNTGTQHVSALGGALMRLLGGRPYTVELPGVVSVPEEVLQSYVGRYELAPGAIFAITLEEGKLFAQLTGQPALQIHPVSATEFVYRAVPARIVFHVEEQGEVLGLVLLQGGREMPARRLPDPTDEPSPEAE